MTCAAREQTERAQLDESLAQVALCGEQCAEPFGFLVGGQAVEIAQRKLDERLVRGRLAAGWIWLPAEYRVPIHLELESVKSYPARRVAARRSRRARDECG